MLGQSGKIILPSPTDDKGSRGVARVTPKLGFIRILSKVRRGGSHARAGPTNHCARARPAVAGYG